MSSGSEGALESRWGWFEMTIYLTFPVAMFWIANQAEWFEDYVIQRKRELWPPEKEDQRRELEEFKERIRKQREEKLLRAAQQSP
uniref:PET100 cytochrome c oxidase chaperone n=1 Tax=Ovis aries TaxID=9940 RepID=A0AC11D7N1_SHEEP